MTEVRSKRLSLEDFKSTAMSNQPQELEKLTGGVLAACHTTGETATYSAYYQNEQAYLSMFLKMAFGISL